MKENQYYMIIKNGKILPHTANKEREGCLESYAYELSDIFSNPDVDSILKDILSGKVEEFEIDCKLVNISVSE